LKTWSFLGFAAWGHAAYKGSAWARIGDTATPAGVGVLLGTGNPGLLRTPGYLLKRLRRNFWGLGTGNWELIQPLPRDLGSYGDGLSSNSMVPRPSKVAW
jgi:hypothetical protein